MSRGCGAAAVPGSCTWPRGCGATAGELAVPADDAPATFSGRDVPAGSVDASGARASPDAGALAGSGAGWTAPDGSAASGMPGADSGRGDSDV